MEKNIIITILPSLFLKIFDEISDNPEKYKEIGVHKKLIVIATFIITIVYALQGSGYSLLLFMHGLFCAMQKQLDHKYYKYGMIILFLGIILNDKNQIKKLVTTKDGIIYILFTFIFVIIEEKLFPEEVSKAKVITRIIIIIIGSIAYFEMINKINDPELRRMVSGNWLASIFYYSTSVIMKLYSSNPLNDNSNYLEQMIKKIYKLFFKN